MKTYSKENKNMKISKIMQNAFVPVLAMAVAFGAGSGCKRSSTDMQIAGSDTMVQLSQKLVEKYTQLHPELKISVQGGGSGTGIGALLNESIQVANASRKMKEKEWDSAKSKNIDVKEHIIALDALSVVVNPENPVKKLTIGQLSKIFTGEITNWKEVGGNDAEIVAISRENNSGTHVYFKEEVVREGKKDSTAEYGTSIIYAVSSQQIIDQVKMNPNAISYVGMGWVDESVYAISVKSEKDGKFYTPTKENAESGKYPLARPLQIYTNEKFKEKSDPFIEFIKTDDGAAIIVELGFIPLR